MKVASLLVMTLWLFIFRKQQDFEKQRDEMVKSQIEKRGVKDPATLTALRKTPRHLFVPANSLADSYDDRPLPIGYGQTISQPYIVAFMTEVIKPQSTYRCWKLAPDQATRQPYFPGL
jgi:protein-L-isoaspartate(D-aspartate) O-methyltransferase